MEKALKDILSTPRIVWVIFMVIIVSLLVASYQLLKHENISSRSLGRTMAIGEARGMVTRCIEASKTENNSPEECISDGFTTLMFKHVEWKLQ